MFVRISICLPAAEARQNGLGIPVQVLLMSCGRTELESRNIHRAEPGLGGGLCLARRRDRRYSSVLTKLTKANSGLI